MGKKFVMAERCLLGEVGGMGGERGGREEAVRAEKLATPLAATARLGEAPFIPPSIHPSIHPFIYPSTLPLTNSSPYPLIHLFTHLLTHPSIHLPIHPPTHPSIQSPTHTPTHSPIHPITHPSTHSILSKSQYELFACVSPQCHPRHLNLGCCVGIKLKK